MDNHRNPVGLLLPIEAADFLGITLELLFAYVRYAPKTRLGHETRLVAREEHARTMFRIGDLVSFDSYLKEPWSSSGDDRPPIPTYIADYLKVECGGQCPRCGRGFKLENAHIRDYALSLSHHHHNLIRICSQCHDEFDSKRLLPYDELVAIKERLISRIRARIAERASGQASAITTIPRPDPVFLGREHDVKSLVVALGESRTLCVQGSGGIGKTQLVLNALLRVEYERPILWVNVESFRTIPDIEFALRSAMVAPAQRGETAQLVEVLDRLQACVVFDGLEAISGENLEPLEDMLSTLFLQTTSTTFLVTTQVELNSLTFDMRLELGAIGEAESLAIIRLGSAESSDISDQERSASAWLVRFCDGHPLTLRLVAGLLNYFKSSPVVVDRIQRLGATILQSPTRRRQSKATSLGMCLRAAYSTLSSDDRRLLYAVSHCPAGCLIQILPSRREYGVDDVQATVAELRRWHLVELEAVTDGLIRLHVMSPFRAYIQSTFEHAEPQSADDVFFDLVKSLSLQAAVMDGHYVQTGDIQRAVIRFREEFPNIAHAVDEAARRAATEPKYLDFIAILGSCVQVFCFVSGLSKVGMRIMQTAADAAMRAGNTAAASELLLQAICFAQITRDHDALRSRVRETVALATGSTDKSVLGNAAMAEGQLATVEERMKDAEMHFEAAVALFAGPDGANGNQRDVGSADNGVATAISTANARMLALALMGRGFVYERTERFREALTVYASALVLMNGTRDVVNRGALLHQIGNCHAYLKAYADAYASFQAAARCFVEVGPAEHLSNSLCELGYVLLDYDPGNLLDDPMSSTILELGLASVLAELRQCFSRETNPLEGRECIRLVRKLFGVAALVSFTPWNGLLAGFAERLREEVIRPLVAQHDSGARQDQADGVLVMHLDVMTALISSVAAPAQTAGLGTKATLAEIEHLALLCYRQYDFAWGAFRLFDWLATYLVRYRHMKGLTAAELQAAAQDRADWDMPFSLSSIS